jgi:hypothetical protein
MYQKKTINQKEWHIATKRFNYCCKVGRIKNKLCGVYPDFWV